MAIVDAINEAANATGCEAEIAIRGITTATGSTRRRAPSSWSGARWRRTVAEPRLIESGGGADANVFNAAGITCVNVCNGMAEIHTGDEHIAVDDLDRMTTVTRC